MDLELQNRGLLEGKVNQGDRSNDLAEGPHHSIIITGIDFPDYGELDLMMASALKMCYDKQTHLRKKFSAEAQRAQKDNGFLGGRQIAYFIYEYFRPSGSYDETQELSGPFSIKLDNFSEGSGTFQPRNSAREIVTD